MTMADTGVPGQVKTQWGRVLLTLMIGGVPTAISFILGGWWWGTAFLLLTLFAACFFFSTVARPIAFTLFAVLCIALLAGAWLDVALHRSGESAWWRTALSILGGVAIGIVTPALFWFVSLFVSTKWLLGVAESHDIEWWPAFSFVAARAFGFALPYVKVENGKMAVGSSKGLFARLADPKLFSQFGGPGTLVVGEGNVVVLERGGRLSRILGQGTYALQRGEWFKEPAETKGIHDLRGGRGDPTPVKNVLTKDGFPLDFTVGGGCRLELKADTDKRPASRFAGGEASSPVLAPNSQYPIYEETIRKAVYRTGDGGWQKSYPGGAIGDLKDVVATYTFDEIMGSPGQELNIDKRIVKQIEEKVKEAIGDKPSGRGLVFGGIGISDIQIPEDVRDVVLQRWKAPIERVVKLGAAETKRQEVVVESQGRAEKISRIEEARMATSDKWLGIIEALQNVLPDMKNERIAFQYVQIVRDLLDRIGDDEAADARRILRLRRLMQDEQEMRAGRMSRDEVGDGASPALPEVTEPKNETSTQD